MPIFTQTSTTTHGNMSLRFDKTDTVIQNRKNFLQENNIAWEDHVCMRCDHSDSITAVNRGTVTDAYQMVDAEVLITQEKDVALMLLTADCLPTTFFDPVTQTLALAHFSRQTIADGLPTKVITYLHTHLHVPIENLEVYTGPHIHKNSYTFLLPQPELPEAIAPFGERTDTTVSIDLPAALTAQLMAMGVPEKNITFCPTDTVTSPEHFSHYQSKKENTPQGRIATIAKITSFDVS